MTTAVTNAEEEAKYVRKAVERQEPAEQQDGVVVSDEGSKRQAEGDGERRKRERDDTRGLRRASSAQIPGEDHQNARR